MKLFDTAILSFCSREWITVFKHQPLIRLMSSVFYMNVSWLFILLMLRYIYIQIIFCHTYSLLQDVHQLCVYSGSMLTFKLLTFILGLLVLYNFCRQCVDYVTVSLQIQFSRETELNVLLTNTKITCALLNNDPPTTLVFTKSLLDSKMQMP